MSIVSSEIIVKTDILPIESRFYGEKDELDLKAICVFSALGFFLDDETYYKSLKVLRPGYEYRLVDDKVVSAKPWFKWHYNPRNITLQKAREEFKELFEQIIDQQTGGSKVILPLSGGLDSRTLAAALKRLNKEVHAYSYSFEGGHEETSYGRKIAKECDFPYEEWVIKKGYLWDRIEELSNINSCYSEFTHPRQMAFIDKYSSLGEVFSLGHMGDLMFDDLGVEDKMPFEKLVDEVFKKVIRKGGLEIAAALWQNWQLEGNFKDYLRERVSELLKKIDIPDSANARIRAFKSSHWVPRWTSTNLLLFKAVRPVTLPYYDNRMCEFICTMPEELLADRQIQIEYLKVYSPELAKIKWQAQTPFNLYNFQFNKSPINLPFRTIGYLKRKLSSNKYVQRNWELQFLGSENERQLKSRLSNLSNEFISKKLVETFLSKFYYDDSVYFSHPVSMLLTLSEFSRREMKK